MLTNPLSPEDPVCLGGFELLGRIGQGGMGQVFLGESPGGEPAAVKVIKSSVVDGESRLRFAQEIEVLKTIWGPRIAAFLGADPEAEQPWLATEYVDGPDLARHVKTHGPLPAVLTAALGAILAEALSAVHTQGLLHRDLKPANILLGPNGPKIIDFGLAAFTESTVSLTAPHQVVGTPVCMAPEQAAGAKPLSAGVDVYALGAVLLFAATGHYPYEAATPYMVFHLVTDAETAPDLSGVPAELLPLLTGMLAQSPADRPSPAEVVQRCRSVIEAQGMKIAQARRRLTAYTVSHAHRTPTVSPDTTPSPAATVAHPPTEIDPVVHDTLSSAVPSVLAPAIPVEHDARESTPPAAVHSTGSAGPGQAVPGRPDNTALRRPKESGRTPRHSLQARRTAEQLRAAYAARAPF